MIGNREKIKVLITVTGTNLDLCIILLLRIRSCRRSNLERRMKDRSWAWMMVFWGQA